MEWFANLALKETAKELIKRFFIPLLFKDNKFKFIRLLNVIFIISVGFILYFLPSYIPNLATAFNIYDPGNPNQEGIPNIIYQIETNNAYRQISRYFLAISYLVTFPPA